MKKLLIIFGIAGWLLLVLSLSSCKKKEVCVSCIEKNINYQADDFCGSEFEAEMYIDLLENDGHAITDWECVYN